MVDLPRDLIKAVEEHAAELERIRRRDNWTGLEEVKLGKSYGGRVIVNVEGAFDDPNVSRRYINEVYYTSLDGTQTGRCVDNRSDHRASRVVTIGYPPGKHIKEVYDVSSVAPVDPSSNEIGVNPHRNQHELVNYGYTSGDYTGKVGNDIPRIDDRQMWNLGLQPWDGMVARVPHGWMTFGSAVQWFPGGTVPDLTAYVPVIPAMGRYVNVSLSRELGIVCVYGNLFAFQYATLTDYIPAWDMNYYPIGSILLEYGMTAISWAHIRPGVNLHAVNDIPRLMAYVDDQIAFIYDLIHILHNP